MVTLDVVEASSLDALDRGLSAGARDCLVTAPGMTVSEEVSAMLLAALRADTRRMFAASTMSAERWGTFPALVPPAFPFVLSRHVLDTLPRDGASMPEYLQRLFGRGHARGFSGCIVFTGTAGMRCDLRVAKEDRFSQAIAAHEKTLEARMADLVDRSPIDIALDLRHLSRLRVGTNAYAAALITGLAADDRFRVTAIIKPGFDAPIGVRCTTESAFKHQEPPHIVHRPAPFFDPSELPLLLDTPAHLAVTQLDLIAYRASTLFDSVFASELFQSTARALGRSAQGLFAISDAARDEIAVTFDLPREEIVVTPMGVVMPTTPPVARRQRRRVLLAVGTDFPHKNVTGLLAMFRLLRESNPDFELHLLGEHAWSAGEYAALSQAGVRYLGAVSDRDRDALYAESTALVFPSLYEGFGMPVLEAMAHGTPVVALSLDTNVEIAGDAALLVDRWTPVAMAQAVASLISDEALWTKLSERSVARASEYSWKRCVDATMADYQRMVKAPRVRSLAERRHHAQLLRLAGSGARVHDVGVRGAASVLKGAFVRALKKRFQSSNQR